MKKVSNPLLSGLVGFVMGGVLVGVAAGLILHGPNDQETAMPSPTSNSSMSMADMTAALQGKTGAEFDQAFLLQMIVHHQGALDMANLAKHNAQHDEVKQLANNILSSQGKEINQMRTWQKSWGYKNDN